MSDDLPIGPRVDWTPSGRSPERRVHTGAHVTLEPVEVARHGGDLYASFAGTDQAETLWTYMAYGPFADEAAFTAWLAGLEASEDPLFFAVLPAGGPPRGVLSFLRMEPEHGVAEVGHIWFGPALQRTRAATEAIFLTMAHVFDDLGYRRFEWKCNALNAASRRAAVRYGFTFEGIFAKHLVLKGRNRDSSWYAMTDDDWPHVKQAFTTWLADANFDADGRQKVALSELIARDAATA